MRCSLNLYSGPWPCGSVWRDTTATRNRSSRRQLVRHRACSPPPPGVMCAHSLPIPQLGSAQGRHRTGVRPLSPTCTTAGSLCVPPESHARRAHRPPCCQSKAPCGSAGPASDKLISPHMFFAPGVKMCTDIPCSREESSGPFLLRQLLTLHSHPRKHQTCPTHRVYGMQGQSHRVQSSSQDGGVYDRPVSRQKEMPARHRSSS